MKRRGILILSVFTLTITGLVVHHRIRTRQLRARAHAGMVDCVKAIGIYDSMVRPRPANLDDLRYRRPLTQADADASIDLGDDPWGHRYVLTIDGPHSFTITCHGADGVPGGTGADEDIVLHRPSEDEGPPR